MSIAQHIKIDFFYWIWEFRPQILQTMWSVSLILHIKTQRRRQDEMRPLWSPEILFCKNWII